MSEQFSWYLARAGGIVAWTALVASVLFGLAVAGRFVPPPARPWAHDVHRYLGGLATIFTGVHLVGLVADNYVHFGIRELLVPFESEWEPGSVALGVVALYALVAVELTSLARRRLPKRLWRGVHLASFPLFAVATVHGLMAGADASGSAYMVLTLTGCTAVGFLTVARRVLRPRGAHTLRT